MASPSKGFPANAPPPRGGPKKQALVPPVGLSQHKDRPASGGGRPPPPGGAPRAPSAYPRPPAGLPATKENEGDSALARPRRSAQPRVRLARGGGATLHRLAPRGCGRARVPRAPDVDARAQRLLERLEGVRSED